MLLKRRLLLAAALSALVLLARLFPAPALIDAATGAPFSGGHLEYPWLWTALTPFSSAADALHGYGVTQDLAFLLFLLILFGPFRWFALGHSRERWRDPWVVVPSLGLHLGLCAAFLAWAVLGPRPTARLRLDDPDLIAVDLHSHTSASWDGRRGFSPAANASWHESAGFDAAFLTDHNTTAGSAQGSMESRRLWESGERGFSIALEGEEVSLDGAHVVLLAPKKAANPDDYQGPAGLRRFLADSKTVFDAPAVLSLPEYWKYHWDELDSLVDAGAAGVELVTESPKAMEFSDAERRRVVELCRRRNLFLSGATDNHGWASAAVVWSVLRVHGWRALSPLELQKAVVQTLRADGYGAVRVAARARVDSSGGPWSTLLDPWRSLWLQARGWTWAQALAALAWAWALPAASWFARGRLEEI